MPNSKPSAASARPTGLFGPSFLRHRTTEVLGSRQFRRVLVSNLCFFLAMGGQGIVRPWLAFQLTDSPFALGLVSAAVAFPMFVLAPFGGVLADRMERRKLILLAQTVAMLSELTVLVLLLTESLEFWHLLVTAGLMGCAFPLIMPARQAIVMNIVGKAGLGSAMALNMAGVNVTRVVGPAAAGVLIPLIRVEGVYMVNLTLYLLAVTLMTRVAPVPPAASARGASMFGSLTEGIRYVGSNRLILVLLVFGLVPMFLAMPFQTLLVVFAEDVWETGSTGLGILNAAAGIGAVVGSIFVASRGSHEGRLKPMMLSVVCFGVLLAVFSACPWFLPAIGLIFVANVFVSTFGTLNNTAIQLLIPDQVRGRISAFLMMSFSLPMLGTLPVAAAADRFGAPLAVAAASLLAVLAALGFYAGSPKLRQLDEHVAQAMSQV